LTSARSIGSRDLNSALPATTRRRRNRCKVRRFAGLPPCHSKQVAGQQPARETRILTKMHHAARRLGAIALLALLVRAILPAGYMIASADTPDGRYLVVQLCDDHRAAPQVIDLDTGKQVDPGSLPSKKSGDKSQQCVFSGAPHIGTPASPAEPAIFAFKAETASFVAVFLRPGRGIAAPPPPSTGPPTHI
jgi:hypothetical protein